MRPLRGTFGLIATAVVTVAVIVLASVALRGARVDLTENNIYTLAPATHELLAAIDEDIEISLYFSQSLTEGMPDLRTYAARVRDVLAEMSAVANGRLKLRDADPAPFSEEEDAATAAGLAAQPSGFAGDSIYFGIVGKNAEGRTETIAYLTPEREQFLEYELARLVFLLDREKSPVIGLVTDLPVSANFDFNTGRRTGGMVSITQLEQTFDVRRPPLGEADALDDVDVLLLLHPKGLSPQALYQIDQFVLGGGRLAAFIDPHAEADTQTFGPGMPPMPAENTASDLGGLLAAWGVEFDNKQVVADAGLALTVSMGSNAAPVRHLGILGIDSQGIDPADVVTAQLQLVNVASAGALRPKSDATTTLRPLLTSSDSAALMAADRFKLLTDPGSLQADFKPTGERYVLAGRVSGTAKSAFPDGPPAADANAATPPPTPSNADAQLAPEESAGGVADGDEAATAVPAASTVSANTGESPDTAMSDDRGVAVAPDSAAADVATSPAKPPHVHRAEGDLNVLLVADTDILGDLLWVRVQEFLGQRIATPWANNGDLLINAIDHLTGSTALVNVRSRAAFQRPFTRVQEMLRSADERMVEQQQTLQTELAATEQRLVELERTRDQSDGPGLTDEQKSELASFTQQKLDIRKRLRQVQRELTLDIERLGTQLKLINILAVPLLLTVVGLLFAFRRRT